MKSDAIFEKLVRAIGQPRAIGSTGYEPIFYAVYPPEKTYQMRETVELAFSKYLQKCGYKPVFFDVNKVVWEILESSEEWKEICQVLKDSPESIVDLQPTINEIVDGENSLIVERLKEFIRQISVNERDNRPVVLVNGLEALHGITRPGTIESRLNGSFTVPTLFFYPGKIEGGAGLSFLGFYPVDSNYRSEHFDLTEAFL